MQIRQYAFDGRFFLAPLAGVSDRPFRKICRELGAAFSYTEMVSAHGLLHGTKQTLRYLDRDPDESPFAVQIFAAEIDVLARGAEAAVRHGADIVDINMACPVRKVCGTGAGAALARDPDRVREAVEAVRASSGVPVTVKIRAGWDDATINCVEVAKAAEAGGASAVALHGRTRAQGYGGEARWALIRAVKDAVSVPVLGSGDVWTASHALRMLSETGCDAVLVARGACGNPWIFQQLSAADRGEPPPATPTREQWAAVVLRHVALQLEHRRRGWPGGDPVDSERQAIRQLRKHLLWYTRGLRNGAAFRRAAEGLQTASDVERLVEQHLRSDEFGFEARRPADEREALP